MPLTIPPFGQYQSPIVPLRGLWNRAPREGDFFINIEVDWATYLASGQAAVQFQFAGNSPVAISQIVALAVDNSRSGSDVQFVFPDSGFSLGVPAREGGVFPVFTNALMFYIVGLNANAGDVTVAQVMNSMPPPVALSPTYEQNHVNLNEANLNNGTTPLIPPPASGTLNSISIVVYVETTTPGDLAQLQLVDGTGRSLWTQVVVASAAAQNLTFDLSGLSLRFSNGVSLVINESTLAGGVTVNAYYSTP
jgi:hypothetical protein